MRLVNLLLLILLNGCYSSKDGKLLKSEEIIYNTLHEIGLNPSGDGFIIVLDSDNCNSCSEFLTNWLITYSKEIDLNLITIIYSGINEDKIEELELYKTGFRIISDTERLMIRKGIISIYPYVIKVSKGLIKDGWEIDPVFQNSSYLEKIVLQKW